MLFLVREDRSKVRHCDGLVRAALQWGRLSQGALKGGHRVVFPVCRLLPCPHLLWPFLQVVSVSLRRIVYPLTCSFHSTSEYPWGGKTSHSVNAETRGKSSERLSPGAAGPYKISATRHPRRTDGGGVATPVRFREPKYEQVPPCGFFPGGQKFSGRPSAGKFLEWFLPPPSGFRHPRHDLVPPPLVRMRLDVWLLWL